MSSMISGASDLTLKFDWIDGNFNYSNPDPKDIAHQKQTYS